MLRRTAVSALLELAEAGERRAVEEFAAKRDIDPLHFERLKHENLKQEIDYQRRFYLLGVLFVYLYAREKTERADELCRLLDIQDDAVDILSEALDGAQLELTSDPPGAVEVLEFELPEKELIDELIHSVLDQYHLDRKIRLEGLEMEEYLHISDLKAMKSISKYTPADNLSKTILDKGLEKYYRIIYEGSYLAVDEANYPEICELVERAAEILDAEIVPDFYLKRGYINAEYYGLKDPMAVLTSGAPVLLTKNELLFLIAHEIGHVNCEHLPYKLLADFISVMSSPLDPLGLSAPIKGPLRAWKRKAEFSADRAGLLACQDFEAAASTILKLSGVPISHYGLIDVQEYVERGRELAEGSDDPIESASKIVGSLSESHPWGIIRVYELHEFYHSERYTNILERTAEKRSMETETEQEAEFKEEVNKVKDSVDEVSEQLTEATDSIMDAFSGG